MSDQDEIDAVVRRPGPGRASDDAVAETPAPSPSGAIVPWPYRGRHPFVDGGRLGPVGTLGERQEPASAESKAAMPRHYETALSLLEHAAGTLQFLHHRRDQLEVSLRDLSIETERAVKREQTKIATWQNLASDLKKTTLELESRLAAMQQRAELAEMRLVAERARADEAERQAVVALDFYQGLQTKIVATLGSGSKAHAALLMSFDPGEAT